MTIATRRPTAGRAQIAKRILSTLPEWFGRPDATASYIALADREAMISACIDDVDVGFLTLVGRPASDEAEIAVIAVERAYRRRGIGRLLVGDAIADCRSRSIKALFVQTLGKSNPDRHYAETRSFYCAVGFSDVAETPDAWGLGMPSLLLSKAL